MAVVDYLNTTGVTRAATTGHDGDGQPTWSAAAAITCRFEPRYRRIATGTGESIVSAGRLFVAPSQAGAINDKITYNGKTYRVIQVDEEMGFSAMSHKVFWLAG